MFDVERSKNKVENSNVIFTTLVNKQCKIITFLLLQRLDPTKISKFIILHTHI